MGNQSRQQRMEAAENYIRADKSDPFVRNRVMSHMNSRVVGFNTKGEDAFYSAETYQEERFLPASPAHPEGQSYMVTVYRSRIRP